MTQLVVTDLVAGVRAQDRTAIGRAITLVESWLPDHRVAARELLAALAGAEAVPLTTRVGVSGVPGVGKSTFIETLGEQLTAAGGRVGVLAVDPSSIRTHGSVLGDKTRMPKLATNAAAFIRPSPAGATLGGVARATAQSMTILEAAGFDTILVETVGVGQSETTVAGMVDTFLFLTLGRTGDQLQGLKRGIAESAEVIAVNKADGEGVREAQVAARELSGVMRMLAREGAWVPPVMTVSGLSGDGVGEVWKAVLEHREFLGTDGLFARRQQQLWNLTQALVRADLEDQLARATSTELQRAVTSGQLSPTEAADQILGVLTRGENDE
jgi:LAO/AO transport system kinase